MLITFTNVLIVIKATISMIFSFMQPYDKKTFSNSTNNDFVLLFLGIILTITMGKVLSITTLAAGVSLLIRYRKNNQ